MFDSADNPYRFPDAARLAVHWRADESRSRPPPNLDPTRSSLRGPSTGGGPADTTKRVGMTAAGAAAAVEGASGGGGPSANWLGGGRGGATADTFEKATLDATFGVADFSMVNRDKLTMTRLLRMMMDATLKPRDPDSRAFGGDGATKRAEQREELKTMDQRIVPFAHDDVLNDYLKNIDQLHSPSGAICQRDLLKGRLVGLLFFSESERSLSFMRRLQHFHKAHSPDFVVVAISLAGKEMMDLTRSFGFFHCAHRDGATWVARDTGLMIRPLTPLPRLCIVNGTTGVEITRGGVTAVLANPQNCFNDWKKGDTGYRYRDWLQAIYI